MPRQDFSTPRLAVEAPLGSGAVIPLARDQAHYLGTVLRLAAGDHVLAFNGRDGEWRASLEGSRSTAVLRLVERTRSQPAASDLHYCFAPLKHARLDYMVQKAVEMGADVLQPVLTRRTQVARVNEERMRANAIEAAEQCGVLYLAEVRQPVRFIDLVNEWPADRLMIFCDEDAETADPIEALRGRDTAAGLGVIVGPEGGFDEQERRALLALPRHIRLSLGPRILRADTAAVAALAVVQAALGDWRPPRARSGNVD